MWKGKVVGIHAVIELVGISDWHIELMSGLESDYPKEGVFDKLMSVDCNRLRF